MRSLLLLGGDVEANPGPTVSEQLRLIAEDIQEIKKGKTEINDKLNAIDEKLEKHGGHEKQISDCTKVIADLESGLTAMAKKVEELESRSRRSNLIVYGLKEQQNESAESLYDTVAKGIVKDILEFTTAGIESIHRLGGSKPGK